MKEIPRKKFFKKKSKKIKKSVEKSLTDNSSNGIMLRLSEKPTQSKSAVAEDIEH